MQTIFQDFKFARVSFELEAADRITLPFYKGSTFRGGFGHAFKKATCVLRNQSCNSCILKEKCPYSYVFETPLPQDSDIMRKYHTVPHPFVMEPPKNENSLYAPGEKISLNVILIGRAVDYLPYFIYSFNLLGEMGIGKGKGKFQVKQVRKSWPLSWMPPSSAYSQQSPPVYESSSNQIKLTPLCLTWRDLLNDDVDVRKATLSFVTPTRIRNKGRYALDLDFPILIRNLLRRISILSYFHIETRLDVDFRFLIEKAAAVSAGDNTLRWFDWERYSQRQKTRMKLGGFVGKVTFHGDLNPFWPYLVLGQVLHVGKGTTFGLGRYIIEDFS